MNLDNVYKVYILFNIIIGIIFSLLYITSKGFIQYYNLIYGILTLAIAIWGLGRYYMIKVQDERIRASIQASWLLVSFGLGYISVIYAPVLSTSTGVLVVETISSLAQILWGSVLLGISYRKGYSIIKV